MKLNKIILKNFQKTIFLDQSFSDGINVITGLTDTGKTVTSYAIMWLLGLLNMSEIDYRKEDTDQTSVEGWFSDGIRIERIKSNTINRYILKKEGYKDQPFDNFGKNAPEEIRLVLGMDQITIDNISLNLNFAIQDDLNFLLDKRVYPASFSAKLFNKLTGNELLDGLFKECNKDSLKFNKELKQTEEKLVKQEEELVDYSQQYKELKKKCNLVKTKFEDIKEKVKIYEELKDLADKIKTNRENQEFVQYKISKIKIISDEKIKDLKKLAEEFKKLQDIFYSLEATENSLQKVEKQIKSIRVVDVDFEELKEKCKQLEQYNELYKSIQSIAQKRTIIDSQINKTQEQIKIGEIEFKEAWNEFDLCKDCKPKVEQIIFGG